jgi:two-component system NtrC family sensor kinase
VLDTVAETAARLCAADTATITIREGEVHRSVASSFSAAEPEHWAILRQRTIVPGRDSVPARVALEGRVVHVADIAADPDYVLPETVASGRRTMLGVPLLREGTVLGTINLARKRVEPFTERQIELIRTFADLAVIAIENARLLDELQARTRDLEESLEYQTRDQRRLEGHQPLDRRCATGAGHSGRNGRPALRRGYRKYHDTPGRGLPLCVEFGQRKRKQRLINT